MSTVSKQKQNNALQCDRTPSMLLLAYNSVSCCITGTNCQKFSINLQVLNRMKKKIHEATHKNDKQHY